MPPGRTCSDGGGGGGDGGGGGGEAWDNDTFSGYEEVAFVVLESMGVVCVTREMQTRRSEAEMVKREGRN